MLVLAVTAARADGPAFPRYDTVEVCHAHAEYAFAATLGEADLDGEQSACRLRERLSMVSAQARWRRASDPDKVECLGLADNRYGYLDRCLEASRSVRATR